MRVRAGEEPAALARTVPFGWIEKFLTEPQRPHAAPWAILLISERNEKQTDDHNGPLIRALANKRCCPLRVQRCRNNFPFIPIIVKKTKRKTSCLFLQLATFLSPLTN